MSDLIQVLPDLDTKPFAHILPSLERATITSNDLVTLDALDIAKRAQVPSGEVRKLADAVLDRLHAQLGFVKGPDQKNGDATTDSWSCISTLDDKLDEALGRGFPTGQVTEITGESAAGKTQVLLTLLLSVQLSSPKGLGKNALYLSSEAPLSTQRLHQISTQHPYLASLPDSEKPSLSRIQSAQLHDLESQDHLLRYQVPVQIARANIGLLVIDSVAANFRAEFERTAGRSTSDALARRSAQLSQLGALLRHLARTHNIAIVVANQVLDRFAAAASPFDSMPPLSQTSNAPSATAPPPPSQSSQFLFTNDPLSLDHQQRFFTGWGDVRAMRDLKTPSLGLSWTNQVAARIVLLKEPILKPQDYLLGPGVDVVGWNRHMKVAFAGWCPSNNGEKGTEFEVWEGGIRTKLVAE